MRFELDTEVNALYIYLREIPDAGVARTIELSEGVNLDVDAEGRTLGVEFVDTDLFYKYLADHGGEFNVPEHAEDIKGLAPA